MGIRGLFEGWHLVILVLVVVVVFGWKRLPDAARSLGRSARILKSEMGEMSTDSKASGQTVKGETADTAGAHPAGEQPLPGEAPRQQQAPAQGQYQQPQDQAPQQGQAPQQPQYHPPQGGQGTGGQAS
ncbi:Sec-independent protein translocase subunit TatA [Luteipulveratus sp. YIM 133132]|uniref:Sec-independent protein translocase protein TatA n=1 Tax=Luteipulveratus flavus TaxID=3031728 RepID=A0ABT6CBD3_9MICO|nr:MULTISPECIES: Sec-independent protein translocase subunit TatA [unclassified Luteipulveratus]MDE9367414.1 Sec-independent protein translocase subunit TatA [Luteipulveratus sp. YIM 133132]MDF8266205.1 Sec-independent protein translocase subunit TatA [Luteipulveratus sp. YIM 133296]